MVPFGAESGVAQQALGVVVLLLLDAFVTSISMLARSSCFGWIRVVGLMGGEALAQIAQTDYTLFRHAGAISEECTGAKIVVVACNCEMLRVKCWRKRERGIAGKSLLYLDPATGSQPLTCQAKLTVEGGNGNTITAASRQPGRQGDGADDRKSSCRYETDVSTHGVTQPHLASSIVAPAVSDDDQKPQPWTASCATWGKVAWLTWSRCALFPGTCLTSTSLAHLYTSLPLQ